MEDGVYGLSPSDYHLHRAETVRPALTYDGGDVAAWQARLRPRLSELLGMESRVVCPLAPRTLWRRAAPGGGHIEKVAFGCEPHAEAVGYLCVPGGLEGPAPAVICMQGHNSGAHLSISVDRDDETAPIEAKNDRDFGLQCLRREKTVALCLEVRSFGLRREQRLETHKSHCLDAALHALLLGWTLLSERVWDVDRAIDYLTTRTEVDPARIGAMGESGGGTIAVYAAALLPRLAFAMPACGFCSFRGGILRIPHCADNYVPGLLNVAEMSDVLGLFAPKPLVVVAGDPDPYYPLAEVERAYGDVEAIYRAAGAADRCRLVVGREGHRFYADAGWSALEGMVA